MNNKPEFGKLILILFLIVCVSVVILGLYFDEVKYNYLEFEGYTISIDVGNEYSQDENMVIYTDALTTYDIRVIKDVEYTSYIYDNYRALREYFGKNEYTISSIKEVTIEDENVILSKISKDEDEYFFYIFDIKKTDDLLCGFVGIDETINESDLDGLIHTLQRVEKKLNN